MPRRNRRGGHDNPGGSIDRFAAQHRRTEMKRGRSYTVQPVRPGRSEKIYTCPGCNRAITAGTEHLTIWRDDGVLGGAADLADRRHWHPHCWRLY